MSKLRILLIDDNPDDRLLIARELRREFPKIEVNQVIDMEQFDKAFEQGKFDIVITDYQLCWNTGVEILKVIKNKYPDHPVVMFTATGSEEIAVEAMKAGLDDYVLKSYKHIIRLPMVIKASLERAQQRREQKEMQKTLKESEEKLAGIVESVTDAMIMMDEQFNIVWINNIARGLFEKGVNPIGEKCYRAHRGRKKVCGHCIVEQSFKDGQVHEFETDLVGVNGEKKNYWCTSSVAAWYEDGRSRMVVEFLRDITERKRTEEEIKKAKEELERQNVELKKVDKIKDSLIRDVTHELKTPVAKHSMQLEILETILQKHSLMDEAQNAVRVMETSIKRQENVIRNILDLSRLEAGGRKYKREEVRVDKILKEVIEDYHYAMEMYRVKPKMNLEKVAMQSDGEMLSHVFANIINNAIKYRKGDVKAKIDVFCNKKEKEAIIKITDNGIGLSKEEKEKVFDRFYQASPSAEGSGVGLTISKMIIEGLGGKMWLESAGRGRGTTVIVQLPL